MPRSNMRGWYESASPPTVRPEPVEGPSFFLKGRREGEGFDRLSPNGGLRGRHWLMARPNHPAFDKKKVVAENRRARFDYAIEETFEAGIALTGTEVKSLRFGEGSIAESYAEVKDGEVWLVNSNVPEFSHGNRFNHEPKRPRKLLLKGREIEKLHGAVARQGMTLVPLSIYFNSRGRAKVELALARGRKLHDKREYEKEKDWKKEQGRLLRQHG